MTISVSTITTPVGPFSYAHDSSGRLLATAFGGTDALRKRVRLAVTVEESPPGAAVRDQVLAYFAGEQTGFDLPLAPAGTHFQHRVWAALRRIPFGSTRSYGTLARELKTSPRAVGRANATNPICLLVPCHRVIAADGALAGFAFGEPMKRRLLEHEARNAL